MTESGADTLVVRRLIRAPRADVFAAWTQPQHLVAWWGPKDVKCIGATIDLRVGGQYRIGNQLPDETIIWIAGHYIDVLAPNKLVFTWSVEGHDRPAERVEVEFQEQDGGRATEVVVTHTAIADQQTRATHDIGWQGCLDGLATYLDH